MNRNTTIVLACIVISGLVLGAIFVLPLLVPLPAMSMLVEFHDKDGNLIDVPMAIQADGAEVTTMKVTVTWTVEPENIQEGTFNLHGVIEIEKEDLSKEQPVYIPLDSWPFDSGEYVSSESHTWTLETLLPMEDKDIGWLLSIKAVLTPTATDLEGNPVKPGPTTTPRLSVGLTWSSQTGALSIIQCAVTKVYPP